MFSVVEVQCRHSSSATRGRANTVYVGTSAMFGASHKTHTRLDVRQKVNGSLVTQQKEGRILTLWTLPAATDGEGARRRSGAPPKPPPSEHWPLIRCDAVLVWGDVSKQKNQVCKKQFEPRCTSNTELHLCGAP